LSWTRAALIGVGATLLAVLAMVGDHLLGDDPGLEDPAAFLISAALSVVAAALLFGLVVLRSTSVPERAAKRALVWGAIAVLTLPLIFLGLPYVVAAGAIALGLIGLRSERRRSAFAGIVLGSVVLLLAVLAAAIETVPKLA
jgi:hypothetical protein